jgi:hypothetical protein
MQQPSFILARLDSVLLRRTIAADRKEANMAEVDNVAAAELCWKLL